MPDTTTQTYWRQRAEANRDKAERLSATVSKRLKKLYSDARKSCEAQVNAALADIFANGQPASRSALYKYDKYRALEGLIDSEMGNLRGQQITLMDTMVEQVYQNTVGHTFYQLTGKPENDAFNLVPKRATNELVNMVWSGKNYSQRVWQNTNALATHLKSDMTDLIMLGRAPAEIIKKLAADMGTGWYEAERVVRTETMYVYNRAAMVGYKASGVERVEVIVSKMDGRTCDKCKEHAGVYDVGTEPLLPRHPHCRCCYAPVVDLSPEAILAKAKAMSGGTE